MNELFRLDYRKTHAEIMLEKYFDYLLEKYKCDINMCDKFKTALCIKSNATHIFEKYFHSFNYENWQVLSMNRNAIPFLEKHLDKLDWFYLCQNPNAIPILEKHVDELNWHNLCENPNAIPILEKHVDKLEWENLCLNPNPNAIPILEKNVNKIHWGHFSRNHNILQLVAKINYAKMKENCRQFAEELASYTFHPTRIIRMSSAYLMQEYEYLDIIS